MGADLVQPRGPGQLLRVALVLCIQRGNLREEGGAHRTDALALGFICREAVSQPVHGAFAHVAAVGVAVDQVVQRAVAQRALGGQHLLDAEQVEDRAQNAHASAHHGAAVVLQAFDAQLVNVAGLDHAIGEPVQS
ncbi:hypothetical protein D9M68_850210 [compost metagenome]